MKFNGAGEKRKFYRNMRENVSARLIGYSGLRLAMMLTPVALCLVALVAVVMIVRGDNPVAALFQSHTSGVSMAMAIPLVKIREWREERGKLATDMATLSSSDEFRTKEGKEKFAKLDADQEGLKAQIDAAERSNALEEETRGNLRPPADLPGGGNVDEKKQIEEKRVRAFDRFLRSGTSEEWARNHGMPALSQEERTLVFSRKDQIEQRDMTASGGPTLTFAGDAPFVPAGFYAKIEEAMKWYGGMQEVAEVLNTDTGQPLPYPTDNDTTNTGELVGEGQQVSTADASVGVVMFGAYKFSTKLVRVSIELLQDSAFDLESYLAKKFGIRLARIRNTKFTVGTGVNEPKGLLAATTVGVSAGTTPALIGDDNATTPDPTKQVGYLDLVALEHSVDKAYRQGAKFMANDTTIRYWKTLKDKYGRPLWVPGMASKEPDTVLNYAYQVNNDMDALATGKKPVVFGALDKYLIRNVKALSIMRLSERFADYGQVAFIGFSRADGNLIDAGTNPVKHILLS